MSETTSETTTETTTEITTKEQILNGLNEYHKQAKRYYDTRFIDTEEVSTLTGGASSETFVTRSEYETTENDIAFLKTRNTSLTDGLSTARDNLSTLKSAFENTSSDVVTLQSGFENLTSDMTTARSNISTLQSDFVTLQSGFENLTSDMTTAKSNISTLQTGFENLASDVTNISANVYFKNEIDSKLSSVYKAAGSKSFAELPAPTKNILGYVYNITDDFTTTNNFVEGSGKNYPAGTNVAVVVDSSDPTRYNYDVLTGSIDLTNYATTADLSSQISLCRSEYSTIAGGIDLTSYATKDDLSSQISLCRAEYSTLSGGVDTSTFVSLSDHATLEAKVDAINMDELAPLIKQAKITYDKAGVINWKQNGSSLSVTERESKFGSSIHFDGTSWLYSVDAIELGGQDFTIDFWVYPTFADNHNRVIDFQRSGGTYTDGLLIKTLGNKIYLQGLIAETLITPPDVTSVLNQWIHLAIVYQHNITTLKAFYNGVCTYSNDSFTLDRSRPFTNSYIGCAVYGNTNIFSGYLDEFRISDGIARWTSDFTPPTSEYSLDSYTVSLFHW